MTRPCPELAGLRWPCEENCQFGKDYLGLDQCQARLYTAIARHTVLVMAALAICAVVAAQLRRRTETQTPPPMRSDQPQPRDPGLIPLTVHEIQRLLAAALHRAKPDAHLEHWLTWRPDTRPEPDGSTTAHDSTTHTPWSTSNWRLPYSGPLLTGPFSLPSYFLFTISA